MVGPDTSCTGTVEVIADVPLLRLLIETWDFKDAETERTLDKRKQSVKTKSEKKLSQSQGDRWHLCVVFSPLQYL